MAQKYVLRARGRDPIIARTGLDDQPVEIFNRLVEEHEIAVGDAYSFVEVGKTSHGHVYPDGKAVAWEDKSPPRELIWDVLDLPNISPAAKAVLFSQFGDRDRVFTVSNVEIKLHQTAMMALDELQTKGFVRPVWDDNTRTSMARSWALTDLGKSHPRMGSYEEFRDMKFPMVERIDMVRQERLYQVAEDHGWSLALDPRGELPGLHLIHAEQERIWPPEDPDGAIRDLGIDPDIDDDATPGFEH